MNYFTAKDGTEIFYEDVGNGAPVVLIHGWPLHGQMWEYQGLALLKSGHRVITYDRRGFGKSGKPASGYDYDTLASDLNGVIEHLNLNQLSVAGFSMGAGEIARYLTLYGANKVSKALLISGVAPYLLKTADNPNGVPGETFNDMKSQLKEDRPHFLAQFTKDFYGVGALHHPVSPEIQNWSAAMAYEASLNATIECVDSFGKTDFRPDMKAFTMPTLVIHGTADKTVPIDAAGKHAARLIKGAHFKAYDGAPHGLFITHKNQLNEDMVSFLGS